MGKPLVEIVEREGNAIKIANIGGEIVYSVTEAARQIGVNRVTPYRWIEDGKVKGHYQDPMNNRLYIPAKVVEKLRPENRFIPL